MDSVKGSVKGSVSLSLSLYKWRISTRSALHASIYRCGFEMRGERSVAGRGIDRSDASGRAGVPYGDAAGVVPAGRL